MIQRLPLSVVVVLFLLSNFGFAQTIVPAGNVSGTWTAANSPYQVQGNILVPDGDTLTVAPGTTIELVDNCLLQVEGTIHAIGTNSDQITFKAINNNNGWNGIYVAPLNSLADSSLFVYCTIEYATGGVGLLRVENFDKVRVENCVLQYGSAVYFGSGTNLINSQATIRNNLYQFNYAPNSGGAIHVAGGIPLIQGNTFYSNSAAGAGGAISTANSTDPVITENTFIDNVAEVGGAISLSNFCDAIISNNVFNGNSNSGYGGGAINAIAADPVITDNTFIDNFNSGKGGVYYFGGSSDPVLSGNYYEGNHASSGGVGYFTDQTNAVLTDEVFVYNNAGNGGVLFMASDAYAKVKKCKFSNNIASGMGGTIYSSGSITPDFINCIFTNNRAYRGGAVSCNGGASNNFINCTFANNHATNDGGVLHLYSDASPVFSNCIFKGNTSAGAGTIIYCQTGTLQPSNPGFIHCDIEGGQTGFTLNGNALGTYSNNIEGDPSFMAPSGGSGELFDGLSADWRLMSGSPCFNAGTPDTTGLLLPATDLAGTGRVLIDTVDIGAYEIQLELEVGGIIGDTSLCQSADSVIYIVQSTGVGPITYQWQFNGTDIPGAMDDTLIRATIPSNEGDYTCIVSSSYGTDTSQVLTSVFYGTPTLSSLGADVSICQGDSVLLIADNGTYTYDWNNGLSTNDSLSIATSGDYFYTILDSNNCSIKSDTVTIAVNALPAFDLGPDQEYCDTPIVWIGTTLTNVTYDWNNGWSNNDSIGVNTSGMYVLEVIDTNNCSYKDSVEMVFHPVQEINLVGDTLCDGDVYVLDAGPGFISYDWNGGIYVNQTVSVVTSGEYSIEAVDLNGCFAYDTTTVLFNPNPVIDLGIDQQFCDGDSVQLNAGQGFDGYNWNNGYSTDSSIYVTTSGQWFVSVTDSNLCSAADTVVIDVYALPVLNLGDSIGICSGDSLELSAGAGLVSYDWNNGYSADSSIYVHTAGVWFVEVIDGNGCTNNDSVVTAIVNPSSGTDIITACNSYTWIDGNTYTSSNNSAQWTLVNTQGCDSIVTLNLTINTAAAVVTSNDPELIANPGATSYQWLDCQNNYAILPGETGMTFIASQNGEYAVQIEENGCMDTSTCYVISNVGLEQLMTADWKVYPNPANDIVTIDFGETIENCSVEVTDPLGQLVSSDSRQKVISLQATLGETPGVYFVKVIAANREVVVPVVKL